MSVDPVINSRTCQYSVSGLSREISFKQSDNVIIPSIGGTRGYLIWQHDRAIDEYKRTASYWETADRDGCCICSVKKWERR